MANTDVSDHVMQNVALKYLRNESHPLVSVEELAIGGYDPSALLTTVLQGVKAIVRQFRGIGMTVNAEDATIVFWVALHQSVGIIPRVDDQIQPGVKIVKIR